MEGLVQNARPRPLYWSVTRLLVEREPCQTLARAQMSRVECLCVARQPMRAYHEARAKDQTNVMQGIYEMGVWLQACCRWLKARWIPLINIFGITFSMIGVLLLFFYATPFHLTRESLGGVGFLGVPNPPTAMQVATDNQYSCRADIGLCLVICGAILQMVPSLLDLYQRPHQDRDSDTT